MTIEGEHPTLEYAGNTVHVCGDHCKEAFMKDPKKHLATAMKGKVPE